MNKGGPAGGVLGGGGAGSGPTAAAAAAAAQKQKTLLHRVETDIANIVDNFSHLVNVARVCLIAFRISPVISMYTHMEDIIWLVMVINLKFDSMSTIGSFVRWMMVLALMLSFVSAG